MREHFVFYQSFRDIIDRLPESEQLSVYKAIVDYGMRKAEPTLSGLAGWAWELIKPQLETNWKRFENGCKGGQYGKRGGNPCFKEGQVNPYYRKKDNPEHNPKDNPDITPKVDDSSKNDSIKRFTKPTLQDVKDYILSNSIPVDAEHFYNYYEANGWKVGRNSMKDWKAAVRTWKRQSVQGKGADIGVVLKSNSPDKYNETLW